VSTANTTNSSIAPQISDLTPTSSAPDSAGPVFSGGSNSGPFGASESGTKHSENGTKHSENGTKHSESGTAPGLFGRVTRSEERSSPTAAAVPSQKPSQPQGKEPSRPAPKVTPLPASQPYSASALTPPVSSKPPAAPKGIASAASESNIRLRSYGSSAIPTYLDSDESVEHDGLSRLRLLNTSFQKSIAKLDPAVDDFEETVRHYIAQRAHIGHALNLKERNKAGTKRKLDQSEATEGPPAKKPAFEVPKFGATSGTSFMDAFAKQSAKSAADLQEEAKRKRKAEDFDSDEDDEVEWERKYEEAERAKRSKLEALSKTGATGFQPLFGDKEPSADGDYDQQEDEEDTEEQESKEQSKEESEEESEDEDIQAAMTRSKSKGSLFDRIEPNPNLKSNGTFHSGAQTAQKKPNGTSSKILGEEARPNDSKASKAVNSSFKPFGANGVFGPSGVNSTPDVPTISPFTPINGSSSNIRDPFAPVGLVSSKKLETKEASTSARTNGEAFSFKTDTSLAAPPPARPVLFGGNSGLVSGAIPGEGLFGSRPSTPSNDEPSRGSVFSNFGAGPNSKSLGDYSWKPGTPVKFGTLEKGGPTVNVTAATPPAKDNDSAAASKSFPNLFGPKPSKSGADAVASVGFNFGGPSHLTASPLLGPSALNSAVSSRATSPGATDTESVNTDAGEDYSDEPQVSLMSSRPGEENEEVLFETRSKALKYITEEVAKEKKLDPGFSTQGVGQLRVLKHRTTGKTRLLLRAEPGSNIVINTALTPSMIYKAIETKGSGAVKFGIPTATEIDHWVVKVKTAAMADELAGILEANKGEAVQS
jgi:hypothetical protein